MVDPNQTTPTGGRGGGGANNNTGGGANNNGRENGRGGTSLGGHGKSMSTTTQFMIDNNFNGEFGYGTGDPNNNLFGSGYDYPFDNGYSNAGALQVNVQKLDGSNYAEWSQTVSAYSKRCLGCCKIVLR